jgi:hypothetical protein
MRETLMAAGTYILPSDADAMSVTMKVARSALPVTLAHWERAGVRATVMAAATYILPSSADAMAVSG